MSKFLPDPQIQSLRAMRAGDISFALPTPLVSTVGVQHLAFAQPTVNEPIVFPAPVPAIEPISGMPSEVGGPIGVVAATTLSEDVLQSSPFPDPVAALETLAGMPSESPVIGVGTSTSVI
jgi:hypothetical protein